MILEVQDLDSDGDFYGDNLECNSLLPCKSSKLSEHRLVLRETLDWMRWWHIWETSPVQLLIISQKFNTSCCTCHECCEWVLGLCSWKAQDQYLRTTMSQKKIESLHDYPRSPANDWLIEHGRHWKSVCLNIKYNRQNSINKQLIIFYKSLQVWYYIPVSFFLLSWNGSSSFNFLTRWPQWNPDVCQILVFRLLQIAS